MSRRRAVVVGAVFVASVVGACGEGDDAATEEPDVTVVVQNSSFVPATVTAKATDLVRWEFKDPFEHTVTADDGTFDTKPTKAPSYFEIFPGTAGNFTYKCTIHPSMTGTLTVT